MKTLVCACLFVFVFISSSFAQFKQGSFMVNGYTLPYRIQFPADYNPDKQYPLVVFLHGAGERGNDNERQLVNGKQFLTDNFVALYPAIVIAPQCPSGSYWANVERHDLEGKLMFNFGFSDYATPPMVTLQALINNWLLSGKVDTNRVYVGGLSMGGMGTLELLWRMPDTFAAAFAICGGSNIDKLSLYANNTALWLFHGDADAVVPVQCSRDIYSQLKKLGGDVKYTEYQGVNHNSWDNAFNEKALVPWLFEKQKSNKH